MTEYLLTVFMGVIIGGALMATWNHSYIRWLKKKLVDSQAENNKLRAGQPWLQGATKEYHLQKKIEGFRETLKKASRFNELSKIESAPAWDSDSPFQKKIDALLADTQDGG